jgi:hypothetical protein
MRGTGCRQRTMHVATVCLAARSVFGRHPGKAPVFLLDVSTPSVADTLKRLLARLLCPLPAAPAAAPNGGGVGSGLGLGSGDGDARGGASSAAASAATVGAPVRPERFNILVCGGLAGPAFAPAMVENDAGGRAALDAMRWLSAALAPPPPPPRGGGAAPHRPAEEASAEEAAHGLHGNEGDGRLRWTDLLELVATAGAGCDGIYILADHAPGQSTDRLLDEVRSMSGQGGAGANR